MNVHFRRDSVQLWTMPESRRSIVLGILVVELLVLPLGLRLNLCLQIGEAAVEAMQIIRACCVLQSIAMDVFRQSVQIVINFHQFSRHFDFSWVLVRLGRRFWIEVTFFLRLWLALGRRILEDFNVHVKRRDLLIIWLITDLVVFLMNHLLSLWMMLTWLGWRMQCYFRAFKSALSLDVKGFLRLVCKVTKFFSVISIVLYILHP